MTNFKYFQPDPIWTEVHGGKSLEEYLDSHVVKARFVSMVHEDVCKSYETVEYLMAHSFYHWQMYDEALRKLFGIVEMAIKLRCQELGIDIQTTSPYGRRKDRRLVELINSLGTYGYPQRFIQRLHWIRELRNEEAHPDRHSFAGGLKKAPVKRILNTINELFIDPQTLSRDCEELELIARRSSEYLGLYILLREDSKVLVYDPKPVYARHLNGRLIYGFYLQPVLKNTSVLLQQNRFPNPFAVFLYDLSLTSEGIFGINAANGEQFSLLYTQEDEYYALLTTHLQSLRDADEFNILMYHDVLEDRIAKQIIEFDYQSIL